MEDRAEIDDQEQPDSIRSLSPEKQDTCVNTEEFEAKNVEL